MIGKEQFNWRTVTKVACERHGYTNPTFCPACDAEVLAQFTILRRRLRESWYCDQCQVEVNRLHCPHCGKREDELR